MNKTLTLNRFEINCRQRLLVSGKLTNCQTGHRVIISKTLQTPIPRTLQIGKYVAIVLHAGQPEFQNKNQNSSDEVRVCHKCLQPGHLMFECTSEWVCKTCKKEGHKMIDCPSAFQQEGEITTDKGACIAENEMICQSDESNNIKSEETVLKTPNPKINQNKQGTKPGQEKNVGGSKTNNSNKSQPSLDKFVKTPTNQNRQLTRHHTPPTPT